MSGFSRKPQDHMDDRGQIGRVQSGKGVLKDGQLIAAVDKGSCCLVNGLQAQLYPYWLNLVQLSEELDHRLTQAVWSCSDGQGRNVRMTDGCGKQRLQIG